MQINRYEEIKKACLNSYSMRLYAEIDYLLRINEVENGKYSDLLNKAIDLLIQCFDKEQTITKTLVLKIENLLMPLQKEAKKYTVICVGHAHIDVNWQWGIDETVSITSATFESVLYLMDHYKDFTFMQSQGFLYDLMNQYRPDIISRIKKYVKEGRLEVTASTYVENDANMIDMNSSNKQYEFSKERVSQILGISKESLDIDFEPDTFGHHKYRPEILANNGVKYVYHCRGSFVDYVYRMYAPSGKSVLCYREPNWYLGQISYKTFEYVPEICKAIHMNTALTVYGVGDHGGGITARDLHMLATMMKWPLMPNIKFGRIHDFFKKLEKCPVIHEVHGEQNKIFSGCYSSIYEIKKGNFLVESALKRAEIFCHFDKEHKYSFDRALEAYLPTHFHDVITGSNVASATHFALGQYQVALSQIGSNKTLALKNLTKKIDTTKLYSSNKIDFNNISSGAGGGYLTDKNNFSASLGFGKERVFALFNASNFVREELVDIQVWDYYGDINKLRPFDKDGHELEFKLKSESPSFYWFHSCHTFSIYVKMPPLGYTTIILKEKEILSPVGYEIQPRLEESKGNIVLENSHIKAVFDKESFNVSLFNKDKQIASNGHFELVREDAGQGMTAWLIGRFKDIKPIDKFTLIPGSFYKTSVKQGFSIKTEFSNSEIIVHISLDKNDPSLKFDVDLTFYEIGSCENGVPMVRYVINPANKPETALYNCAGGLIERPADDYNYVALSLVTLPEFGIFGKGLHGYRYDKESLSVTLLRNSIDPYINPELGNHQFTFRLFVEPNLAHVQDQYSTDIDYVLLPYQKGDQPLELSYMDIDSRLMLNTINEKGISLTNPGEEGTFKVNGKDIFFKKEETKII